MWSKWPTCQTPQLLQKTFLLDHRCLATVGLTTNQHLPLCQSMPNCSLTLTFHQPHAIRGNFGMTTVSNMKGSTKFHAKFFALPPARLQWNAFSPFPVIFWVRGISAPVTRTSRIFYLPMFTLKSLMRNYASESSQNEIMTTSDLVSCYKNGRSFKNGLV